MNRDVQRTSKQETGRERLAPAPRRTVLIGLLPPPATGQSVSFGMLVNAFETLSLPHRVVDISPKNLSRMDGRFSFGRGASFATPFLQVARLLLGRRRQNVYLLIAQSWAGFMRDFVFITLAALGRHRLVVHLKGGNYSHFYARQSRFRQRLIRFALSRTDAILVLASCFRELFSFVPGYEQKVRVVLNGLPLPEDLLPTEAKRLPTPPTPESPLRILFLSNLIDSKGYLELLEAVRILVNERGLAISCTFCGDFMLASETTRYASVDEARVDFLARVVHADLENVVTWTGSISDEDKLAQLREAHFFVLPTWYSNEGQPVSIIEALASGCCVISTRYRSIPEMLEDGRAGVLLERGIADEIAAAIESFVGDPTAYEQLSHEALAQYRNRFRQTTHLARIMPLILGDASASRLVEDSVLQLDAAAGDGTG